MRRSGLMLIVTALFSIFVISMADLIFQWDSKVISLLFPIFILYLAIVSLINSKEKNHAI